MRQLLKKSKTSEIALLHSLGNLNEIEDQLLTLKEQDDALAYVRALKLLGRQKEASDYCNKVCYNHFDLFMVYV